MARIDHPPVTFGDSFVPYSEQFGDIYFSPADGLNETKTVFLQGNNLPDAWQGRSSFTIAETGFGTGLNFLATVAEFAARPGECRHLHFISVEKFPLSPDQLIDALRPWRDQLPDVVDRLIRIYPLRMPGFHRLWFSDNVTLTLIFDDAIAAFSQLHACVDAWFLDGFAPAKNPEMWQPALYQQMARLSHADTTIASFTAAGDVRRGLQDAGFAIERVSGFANKRHRIIGTVTQGQPKPPTQVPSRIAIVGAGLAGATLAQTLQRYGLACTVFDQHPHMGLNASSNRLGLINPKIDLGHDTVMDLNQSMYGFALHRIRDAVPQTVALQQCGILHAATDDTRHQRQAKVYDTLNWLPGHVTQQADGLFFPDAATVNTGLLVEALLDGINVQWDQTIDTLNQLTADFDLVIIASSEAARQFYPHLEAILRPTRGQVTFIKPLANTLPYPITAGHYVASVSPDQWVTGATFQRGRTDTSPDTLDDDENIAALKMLVPTTAEPVVTGHWAQIRYATPDHRPVLGCVAPHVQIIAGLGSHGLQYSFMLAEIMASHLCGMPMPVGADVLDLLDLHRYPAASP